MGETGDGDRLMLAVHGLLQHGPMPIREVIDRLTDAGDLDDFYDEYDDVEELTEVVLDHIVVDDLTWLSADRTLALTSPLTDGLVLTHRVTAEEIEQGGVWVTPDLVLLDWDAEDTLTLAPTAGGRAIAGKLRAEPAKAHVPGEDTSALFGPDGWLDRFQPGDLLAFTRQGDTVTVEAVDAGGMGNDRLEIDLLAAAIDGWIEKGASEEAVPLILDALVAGRAWRGPVRPLGELLEAAGLERRGFSFGRAREPWETRSEMARRERRLAISRDWELDGCCESALDTVIAAYDAFLNQPGADGWPAGAGDMAAVAAAMAHGDVAGAFAEFVLGDAPIGNENAARFTRALASAVGGSSAAPALLVAALEAERHGDALAAEATLREAVAANAAYEPAAVELAHYELDRGNLARAAALWRSGGTPAASAMAADVERAQRSMSSRYRDVGRNDPCPCGSGRKFKACCQANPKTSMADRIPVVRLKLVRFGSRRQHAGELVGLASSAYIAGEDVSDDEWVEAIGSFVRDPLITDIFLVDTGLADEYLAERGELLPADERQLLERVAAARRRLWQVLAADPGTDTVRLGDDGGDQEVTVRWPTTQQGPMNAGDTVLVRLVDVEGDGALQPFGVALKVPPEDLDAALMMQQIGALEDPDELARWYGELIDAGLVPRDPLVG